MNDVPQPCDLGPKHVKSYSEAVTRPSVPMVRISPPNPHGYLTAISTPSLSPPPFPARSAPRPTSHRPVWDYCGIRGRILRFYRGCQLDEHRGYATYNRDAYFGFALRKRLHSPPPRQLSPVHDARNIPLDSRPSLPFTLPSCSIASSSCLKLLRPQPTAYKLDDAVCGGKTSFFGPITTAPKLLCNLLSVLVEGIQVRSLVNSGASISVIHADLHSRLQKVKAPYGGPYLQGANKTSFPPLIALCA